MSDFFFLDHFSLHTVGWIFLPGAIPPESVEQKIPPEAIQTKLKANEVEKPILNKKKI